MSSSSDEDEDPTTGEILDNDFQTPRSDEKESVSDDIEEATNVQ